MGRRQDFISALQQAVNRARLLRSHPRIAQIYDFHYDPASADGPKVAVSSEFCDGKSLAELPSEGSPFCDPKEIEPYVHQLCDALASAHEQGLTHQAINPASLIICDGGLKLVDFGLGDCLYMALPAAAGLTQQTDGQKGMAEGRALRFMSPQKAKWFFDPQGAARPSDTTQDDIFAFGATIYQLLTGSNAYTEEQILGRDKAAYEAMRVRRHHHWGRTRTAAAGDIPGGWERGVERSLRIVPSQRPAAGELAKILSSAGGMGTPIWERKGARIAAMAAGVAIVLAAAVDLLRGHRGGGNNETTTQAATAGGGSRGAADQGLLVDVKPTNATVQVFHEDTQGDQEPTPFTNAPIGKLLKLPVGEYFVSISAEGYTGIPAMTVSVPSNDVYTLSTTLRRSKGSLVIAPNPDGFQYELKSDTVTRNGTSTPSSQANLDTGSWTLTLRRKHWQDMQATVKIADGSNTFNTSYPYGVVTAPEVKYSTNVAGSSELATLSLDDTKLDPSETTLLLEPGPHKLTAALPNWKEQVNSFTVGAGSNTRLEPFCFWMGKLCFDANCREPRCVRENATWE